MWNHKKFYVSILIAHVLCIIRNIHLKHIVKRYTIISYIYIKLDQFIYKINVYPPQWQIAIEYACILLSIGSVRIRAIFAYMKRHI